MSDFAKIVHKPGNKRSPWTVRFSVGGRTREQSFPTKKLAQDRLTEIKYRQMRHDFVDPAKGKIKYAEVAQMWMDDHPNWAPNTRRNSESALRNHILPYVGDVSVEQFARGYPAIHELLRVTLPAKGLKPNTIKTVQSVITGTIGWARDMDYIPSSASVETLRKISRDSVNGISRSEPRDMTDQFPTPEQLAILADNLPEGFQFLPYLIRGTGLRIGEAMAVRHENFRNGMLRITEQQYVDGSYRPLKWKRSGHFREIPVPHYVKALKPEGTTGYVFPQMSRRSVERYLVKARKAAGLPDSFGWHVLRHVYASTAISAGVPIFDVSQWLGHTNINVTTGMYGHLVPEASARARAALDREYGTWTGSAELGTLRITSGPVRRYGLASTAGQA